jgi:hypothetical protein
MPSDQEILEEVNKRLLELERFCLENDFETSFFVSKVIRNENNKDARQIIFNSNFKGGIPMGQCQEYDSFRAFSEAFNNTLDKKMNELNKAPK